MIPIIGIPVLNRGDLLARCISSIDYPVENLVIVNNGSYEDVDDAIHNAINDNIKKTIVIKHPNAGVAGSWNEIIMLFPARMWMIVGNDIQFTPGDLVTMVQGINDDAKANGGEASCYYANHGHSLFVITQTGVTQVGLYDANIYPAYLEDCDWCRRADLLKARQVNIQGIKAIHGEQVNGKYEGSSTVRSDRILSRNNGRTHHNNFVYYKAKWGGSNGEEVFKYPFNNPSIPLWAWNFMPEFRFRQQWTAL